MGEYEVIIIGAGMSGMSAAIYLKRAGVKVMMVESNVPGGQMQRIGVVENYPGYDKISGADLASNLLEQVLVYGVVLKYGKILEIDYEKRVVRFEGEEYNYQYLVLATGRRERRLGLPLEEELIGHGISFCATCDGALYKDRDVVVVGGGNSAVSEAIYLARICKHVSLVYRGSELRAENILKDRLEGRDNIKVFYNEEIGEYLVKDGVISGVKFKSGKEIDTSCVFLAIGYLPNGELFEGKKDKGYIATYGNGRTSRDCVYACGDVCKKELYQLVTASYDGVMVAYDIISRLEER